MLFPDISEKVKDKIKKVALENKLSENPTIECCGLVLEGKSSQRAKVTKNASEDPTQDFLIEGSEIRKAEKNAEIIACFHTHFGDEQPSQLSEADIRESKISEVPYLLYHVDFDEWDFFDPSEIYPYINTPKVSPKTVDYYVGWKWEWNRCDCWGLVRAYCNGVLEYGLEDHVRPIDMKTCLEPGWDTFASELLPDKGFEQVFRKPIKDDIVLMNLEGTTAHHVGVMISDTALLHHLQPGDLSSVRLYGGALEEKTVSVWAKRKLDTQSSKR